MVADQPMRRELHIEVIETDRHVPSRVRVELQQHEVDLEELEQLDEDETRDRRRDQEEQR